MAAELPTLRLPDRHLLLAAAVAVSRALRPGVLRWGVLDWPRPKGLAIRPRDSRPADPENGRRILAGGFVFAGETLALPAGADPFDRPSPSARFAAGLHRFGWLKDLLALGAPGEAEALRLILDWDRAFGHWNSFAWATPVLERRVFNLACGLHQVIPRASEAETARLAASLARQARWLLAAPEGRERAAERACAAAVAGAGLRSRAGRSLLAKALRRLERVLPQTVTPEGGHVSRSPQAALELLFDLTTLDDALGQRGAPTPEVVLRAQDHLAAAVRFFTLGDRRLAAFQGGETLGPTYIAAALAYDELGERPIPPTRDGYHRLEARSLQVMADAGAPAPGPWSATACAQPLALEVLAGSRRLIVGSGWSPAAVAPQAVRLVDAASTASVGDASCGAPLRGFAARVLGPRLAGAWAPAGAERHDAPGARWLELWHDGWARRFGFRHQRRLYLDVDADELRGEDRLAALKPSGRPEGRRFVPFRVRFHLHPQVSALIAQDRRGVLLRAEGEETGWWLRSDALDVTIEPSVHYEGGEARRSQQIVLSGQARRDQGAVVRWKLAAAARVDEAAGAE